MYQIWFKKNDIAKAALETKRKKLNFMQSLFEMIGVYMTASVQRTFKAEGRPRKWKTFAPLADSTKKIKAKRNKTKILSWDGFLANSITHLAKRFEVWIGSSLPYAAAHQFGLGERSTISTKKRIGKLPARPYLLIQDKDRRVIGKMIGEYMGGTA